MSSTYYQLTVLLSLCWNTQYQTITINSINWLIITSYHQMITLTHYYCLTLFTKNGLWWAWAAGLQTLFLFLASRFSKCLQCLCLTLLSGSVTACSEESWEEWGATSDFTGKVLLVQYYSNLIIVNFDTQLKHWTKITKSWLPIVILQ